jgi:hypothetical protein
MELVDFPRIELIPYREGHRGDILDCKKGIHVLCEGALDRIPVWSGRNPFHPHQEIRRAEAIAYSKGFEPACVGSHHCPAAPDGVGSTNTLSNDSVLGAIAVF